MALRGDGIDFPLHETSHTEFVTQPAIEDSQIEVIYLDFDGAEGVTFDGPVKITGIEVPAFAADGFLQGQEDAILASTLASLADDSREWNVVFTTSRPRDIDFSTIYVGGDGLAFAEYGSYIGLSEGVDFGNRNHRDSAFVFSDAIPAARLTAEPYGQKLAGFISREAGHPRRIRWRWPRTSASKAPEATWRCSAAISSRCCPVTN